MTETYRVEITATAEADMSDIWEYIARDNPTAATEFVMGFQEKIETLENFPERCPFIPENEHFGTFYRHLLHGRYRIIFTLTRRKVIILRVLHGARLLNPQLLENW